MGETMGTDKPDNVEGMAGEEAVEELSENKVNKLEISSLPDL